MKTREISVGDIRLGGGSGLFLIAGPCVIETPELTMEIARKLKEICAEVKIPLIFKASFDKANRSSLTGFRGPGIKLGLEVLKTIRQELSIPVLTDFHEASQADIVAEAVDIIQIPALLARQTDMLVAAGQTGKPVNVKKGQFMAPGDMAHVLEKVKSTDNFDIMLTERGTSFGYHYLVNDMRSLPSMRMYGFPVIFDATHSVQMPGTKSARGSGGERQFVAPLARAAVATGVDGVFIETHPDPEQALSDGANMLHLDTLPKLLSLLLKIDQDVHDYIAAESVAPPRERATGRTMVGGVTGKVPD